MINVFTLTNISIKIIKGKLSKIFILEVCIKLGAFCINRYKRSSSQFQKGWSPLLQLKELHFYCEQSFTVGTVVFT